MKRLIAMITVTALLSSCGVFKKVFKHKITESVLEQSSKSEKSEAHTFVTDNSVITITERLDSNIKSPEVRGSAKSKIDLAAISQGLNLIDDQFINLYQIYNPIDSSLHTSYVIKPRPVPVPKERKTEIHKAVNTNQQAKQESQEQDKKWVKKTEAIVDRKPDYKVVFILILVICIAILGGWIIKIKKIFAPKT